MNEKNRIRVRLLPHKGGVARAQLFVGSAALGGARPLTDFSDAVQARLSSAGPGTEVNCAPMAKPDPRNLVPVDVAPPRSDHRPVEPRQAPASPFDRNPYNFAEWEGDQPWLPEAPDRDTHERWWTGGPDPRVSGTIVVELTARTPVFVPEGRVRRETDEPDTTPQRFWRCADAAGRERFAIPGSSIKGTVRTLFEALTNSRLGIVSEAAYEKEIPYRRRSATTWVIAKVGADESRDLVKCEVKFVSESPGSVKQRKQAVPRRIAEPWSPPGKVITPPKGCLDPTNTTDWQNIPYRANLLWTDGHTHEWKRLYVKVGGPSSTIADADVQRYRKNLQHAMYEANPDHAANATKNFYSNNPQEKHQLAQRLRDLERLEVGDLIFGIPNPGRRGYLACFGKNINFLWPSARTPGQLLEGFGPRDPASMGLPGADYADLVFGFAGADAGESHPFRGKIRFTTFWALGEPTESQELRLGPLTSPAGTKLKARPLYLRPGNGGVAQTYDQAARLRGRKFYWHQHAPDKGVPACHLAREGQAETQLPAPIRPLPAGTTFAGRISFDNLSEVELGALLAALCPARLFEGGAGKTLASARYGWKIGKGKPRGLGSVEATRCIINVRPPARVAYARLQSGWDAGNPSAASDDTAVAEAVRAYRDWARQRAGGDTAFMKDLERLLRLPDGPVDREYLEPQQYGWMPDFEDPAGERRAGRPLAMKRARDL